MTPKELQENLKKFRDEKEFYFSIAQVSEQEDIVIEANRNGILKFCQHLLDSIDEEHLRKNEFYDFPDEMWDNSNVAMSIRLQEGKKVVQQHRESVWVPIGCFLVIALTGLSCIIGFITSMKWIAEFF